MTEERIAAGALTHLRCAGVSLVLDSRHGGVPGIVYWGSELGELTDDELSDVEFAVRAPVGDSRVDVPERVSLLPMPADGWVGRPGITGSREGRAFSPSFDLVGERPAEASQTIAVGRIFSASDEVALLDLTVEVEMAKSGLIRLRATLTNTHPTDDYSVDGVTIAVPVPTGADELLDLTGRHARERVPQRRAVQCRHPPSGVPPGKTGS